MSLRRREFLTGLLGAPALLAQRPSGVPVGLNTYCLRAMRWNDTQLLDYTASLKLDAVFLQDSLDPDAMQPAHWSKIRDHAARLGLHLETGGGVILPKNAEAFETTVQTLEKNIDRAKGLGSPVVRGLVAGDRYSMPPGPSEQHIETVVKVLKRVRSRAMDAGLKIAIENHKDLQAWETRLLIETAGKEFVGSYLDTGNPVFVAEDPMTTMEQLGPYAVCVHLRDSVIYEHPNGIAVQWVPLGEGVVDFPAIIAKMKEICPPVAVYVKPITGRPAAIIPYLDPGFWKLFPKARASELSRFLALAKKGRPYERPMVVEDIPGRKTPEAFIPAIQLQQREHMERSVEYAKKTLGLGVRWRT
jgi:sugar phosphate isomerase/epimerase